MNQIDKQEKMDKMEKQRVSSSDFLPQVESLKSSFTQIRAPMHEQLIRQDESKVFLDPETSQIFTYAKFSAAVKKFGFGGVTELTKRHVDHFLEELYEGA